jgi:hypothetical protein
MLSPSQPTTTAAAFGMMLQPTAWYTAWTHERTWLLVVGRTPDAPCVPVTAKAADDVPRLRLFHLDGLTCQPTSLNPFPCMPTTTSEKSPHATSAPLQMPAHSTSFANARTLHRWEAAKRGRLHPTPRCSDARRASEDPFPTSPPSAAANRSAPSPQPHRPRPLKSLPRRSPLLSQSTASSFLTHGAAPCRLRGGGGLRRNCCRDPAPARTLCPRPGRWRPWG